jgi:hypothetical protein
VFEAGIVLTPRVDHHARITVRQSHYSVPVRFIGRRVRVLLRAAEVVVLDGRQVVARHERAAAKKAVVLDLDHYLEVLGRKPGALPGATALVQARANGTFTAEHEAFWALARARLGDGAGTRALVEVLLLHRHLDRANVLAALRAAVALGATSADVVAVEARRFVEERRANQPVEVGEPVGPQVRDRVVSLTERRLGDPEATIAALPPDHRPAPSVAAYDELLTRRTHRSVATPQPHSGAS